MKVSPFSCPIFLRHPKARGRCSQGERVLYGRDLCRSGGTGKAEAAKLPGAGIGPKLCPGNCVAEKGRLPEQEEIGMRDKRGLHPLAQKDFQDSRLWSEMNDAKGMRGKMLKDLKNRNHAAAAQHST